MIEVEVPDKLSIIPEYYSKFLSFAKKLYQNTHQDVILVFPNQFWTYPAGVALLAQYALEFRKKGSELKSRNMQEYISKAVKGNIETILDLTTINSSSQTESASEKIVNFLFQYPDYKEYVPHYLIQENLDEMMSNAFQHSGKSSVSVYGQYYPTKKEITFSVLDVGIGIPNHIRNKYPDFETDSFCIKKATELGITGADYSNNSGVGLYKMKEFVTDTKSNLRILSGDGYLESISGMEKEATVPIPFTGTIVDFQFILEKYDKPGIPTLEDRDLPF